MLAQFLCLCVQFDWKWYLSAQLRLKLSNHMMRYVASTMKPVAHTTKLWQNIWGEPTPPPPTTTTTTTPQPPPPPSLISPSRPGPAPTSSFRVPGSLFDALAHLVRESSRLGYTTKTRKNCAHATIVDAASKTRRPLQILSTHHQRRPTRLHMHPRQTPTAPYHHHHYNIHSYRRRPFPCRFQARSRCSAVQHANMDCNVCHRVGVPGKMQTKMDWKRLVSKSQERL